MTDATPDLAARIADLEDRAAIADAIHAYCWHFDRNEPDALADLFADGARVDYGPDVPEIRGRAAIRAAVARGLAEIFAATSHHVSNIRIAREGPDAARSTCLLYAWHRYRSGAPDGELWAQYHHRFLRIDGAWKIAELRLAAAGTKDFHRARMHPIGRA